MINYSPAYFAYPHLIPNAKARSLDDYLSIPKEAYGTHNDGTRWSSWITSIDDVLKEYILSLKETPFDFEFIDAFPTERIEKSSKKLCLIEYDKTIRQMFDEFINYWYEISKIQTKEMFKRVRFRFFNGSVAYSGLWIEHEINQRGSINLNADILVKNDGEWVSFPNDLIT